MKCSITLTLMNDPVITKDGQSYDRVAIEKWLDTNSICPITRKSLTKQVCFISFLYFFIHFKFKII